MEVFQTFCFLKLLWATDIPVLFPLFKMVLMSYLKKCHKTSPCGWLGRAMVLGNFQCRGVLLLWHVVGQGPAVIAAGAVRVGCFFIFFFSSHLSYLLFLMPHLFGDG